MKKGNFIFGKILLTMLLLVGMISKINVLQVQAASHSQTEAVDWAQGQINKGLDYDGVYGNQCVDLIKYYYQYLGCANYATGNACAYAWNNLPSGWTRVYSDFQPGDIAVWKVNHRCSTCNTGELGHVGVITSADSVGFNAVNQNFCGKSYCTQNWFYCSALQCAIRPNFSSASNTNIGSGTDTAIAWTSTVSDITYTNATLSATVSTSTSVQYQWAGCNIFDNNGTMIAQAGENTSVKGYYMNIWYDISAETWNHFQLSPGTTYQYQFYATYGGKDYFSPVYKFTTPQQTVNVTGVSLNQTSKNMIVGEKFQLNASISPSNATNKNVTWSVDDSSVAVVDKGLVIAQGVGVANVTVKTTDGSKVASCSISVSQEMINDQTEEDNEYTLENTNIDGISSTGTGIKLNWKAINDATGYYVFKKFNNEGFVLHKKIESNYMNSYTDTSVKNGTTYYYKIVAYKLANGTEYRSDDSNVMKTCYLEKNAIKKVSNSLGKRAKLSWYKNAKATGYEIEYANTSNYSNSNVIKVRGSFVTSKTISKLTKGKTYYLRVRTYRIVDGVTYYSCWSNSKKLKITK